MFSLTFALLVEQESVKLREALCVPKQQSLQERGCVLVHHQTSGMDVSH